MSPQPETSNLRSQPKPLGLSKFTLHVKIKTSSGETLEIYCRETSTPLKPHLSIDLKYMKDEARRSKTSSQLHVNSTLQIKTNIQRTS